MRFLVDSCLPLIGFHSQLGDWGFCFVSEHFCAIWKDKAPQKNLACFLGLKSAIYLSVIPLNGGWHKNKTCVVVALIAIRTSLFLSPQLTPLGNTCVLAGVNARVYHQLRIKLHKVQNWRLRSSTTMWNIRASNLPIFPFPLQLWELKSPKPSPATILSWKYTVGTRWMTLSEFLEHSWWFVLLML